MISNTAYKIWSDVRSSWCNYEIVGESYHIENIRSLFPRSWNRDGEEIRRDVELVPEPNNPYDEWAISVRVNGLVVGYLEREHAPAWAAVVRRITASGLTAITDGRIYIYDAPDWGNLDRHGDPRTVTRARISIKLGDSELALPLNDPPTVPYTLLPQSSMVQVTKEDEHFDTLFDYVPPTGRGLLYVTLHESVVTTARTTKVVVEVRIDDRCVGQLTPQMSQRFLPMIQHLNARGLVTACQGDINGSSIAAEVRIDAVKANEADDGVLNGPAATAPALISALENPRAYRVPAAYSSDRAAVSELRPPRGQRTMPLPVPGPRRGRDNPPIPASVTVDQAPAIQERGVGALLIAVLIVGGFFAVLIPYVGPIVWLAAWGAAVYLIVRRTRRALRARRLHLRGQ
jgi:hypothetical protein